MPTVSQCASWIWPQTKQLRHKQNNHGHLLCLSCWGVEMDQIVWSANMMTFLILEMVCNWSMMQICVPKLTKLQQTLFKWIDFGLIIGSWTPENIFYVADICITVCIVPSISGYVIFQMFESWRKLEDYFPKCFKFIILCVKPVNRFVNKGFMCLLSSFCLYFNAVSHSCDSWHRTDGYLI